MRIRIISKGLYSSTGPVAVGTEIDVAEEPTAWNGRYEVIGDASRDAQPVTAPRRPRKKS